MTNELPDPVLPRWLADLPMKWHGQRCELHWGEPLKEQQHVCGLQGFGALGDICPGCQGPFTYRAPRCTCGLFDDVRAAWQAQEDWQPIATAPKDGSFVLLFDPTGLVMTGYWLTHTAASPCWWSKGYKAVFPTHWLPLPDPPAEGRA